MLVRDTHAGTFNLPAAATQGRIDMDKAKDPVCGMTIARDQAAGQSEYEGTTFYFCSSSCKARFDADPAQFASLARP